MDIVIAITPDALEDHPLLDGSRADQTGAVLEFRGLIRRDEAGQSIAALEYEAYQPMAENMIRRILSELNATHRCDRVIILHRIGIVPVGQAAIIVRAFSKHRAAAFALVSGFMDRLKQDVPIWKLRSIPASENPGSAQQ